MFHILKIICRKRIEVKKNSIQNFRTKRAEYNDENYLILAPKLQEGLHIDSSDSRMNQDKDC